MSSNRYCLCANGHNWLELGDRDPSIAVCVDVDEQRAVRLHIVSYAHCLKTEREFFQCEVA